MAPTDKAIAKALAAAVREIYNSPKRDELTVNYARQVAEENLGLESGFLKEEEWKAKSKQIILDTLNELESEEAAPSPKKKAQAASPKKAKAAPKKRAPKRTVPSDDESVNDSASDAENTPEPPSKKRKQSPEAEPGQSDAALEAKPTPEKAEPSKPPASDDESELSEVIDEPPKRKRKGKAKRKSPPPEDNKTATNVPTGGDDSSSELSEVIDEPPKRKRKGSGDKSKSKATSSKAAVADSPDEAQIKLLQSQLVKCGVRKIWAVEFKKHGANTAKDKIRHLKQMLIDVGMTGRFSEAKAREIREMRELQAEMQEVMQGEKSWGVGAEGGRGTRRRAAASAAARVKKVVDSDSGDDDSGDGSGDASDGDEDGKSQEGDEKASGSGGDSDEEDGGKPVVRKKAGAPAKRRADPLAFLGSESESE